MDKIKSITFDKEAQNNLHKEVKDRMQKDRKQAEKKQLILHDVSNSLPTEDVDEINGNFTQAERALLRIDPSGENPDLTEIFELLQWFRDKLLGNDC